MHGYGLVHPCMLWSALSENGWHTRLQPSDYEQNEANADRWMKGTFISF